VSDLKFRENTYDKLIWDSVFTSNEYKIPDRIDGHYILECGGHIGSFASLCKSRGAACCWSVEPNADNFKLMCHNVASTPGDMVYQPILGAAWRSDKRNERLATVFDGGMNTGAGMVGPAGAFRNEVTVFQFDDLIRMVSNCGRRRVNLVKLDCEGSEWPILFTSKMLSYVDRIVGEYHLGAATKFPVIEGRPYNLDMLRSILENEGFEVEIEPPVLKDYNLFWAKRVRFGGKYQ
jgi:FkbM family methyltransferase